MKISDSTINTIKQIRPDILAWRGILSIAPNSTRKKRIYICPFCGSGSHENQSSALSWKIENGIVKWFCHSCMSPREGKDNIHLFAAHYGLNAQSDFQEICRRVCNDFTINFKTDDDANSNTTHKKNKPITSGTTKKIEAPRLKKINNIIANSQNNLQTFIESQGGSWRGLTYETLQHFHCGYLPDWQHSKKTTKSPRVIIPASTTYEIANYLARLTVPITDFDEKTRQFITDKEHDGEKTLFNTDALSKETIIVVEGYIDAISIWQANNKNVVALGAANQGITLLSVLDNKDITNKKFILVFDSDQREKNFPVDLQTELQKRGNLAVCKFIYDFLSPDDQTEFGNKVDANQILQTRGNQFLNNIIEKIISATEQDFYALEKKIADAQIFDKLIAGWQINHSNAPINPNIIAQLRDAKSYIDALTADQFNPFDVDDLLIRRKIALCKFYIPQLATKFFVVMKDTQTAAKKKIKELQSQKPPADVPAELFALAALTKSKTEADIDKLATQIARDQKDYQQQKKIDEINAMREESKNRVEFTVKNVDDCPINLKIPYSVHFNEQGIAIVDDTGRFPKRYQATSNPIVPTKVFREPTKHITQYEVAIKTNENVWRKTIVDGRTLFDPRKILELADYGGALISDPSRLAKFFAYIIAENKNNIPEIKCYRQPGWHGDKFIYPTPNDDDDYIVRRAGFDYEKEFATHGDASKWKKGFIDACKFGGAVARIFLGFTLASLLVRPFNVSNLQAQLNGKSGSGKTALEKLAASIFGNPRKLIRTFGATLKNRQAVAAAYCDLPTFLDELGTLQGGKKGEESLPQMIYEYELGTANQANKRDGSVRETFEFFGSRLMTGEKPLVKNHDPRGIHKRIVQLHVNNLFDDYFASALHFLCENHFGHFGKAWADFVSNHLEEIRNIYIEFGKIFRQYPQNVEPTQLKAVTIAAIAFQFFLICIGLKESFDDKAAVADIKEIISTLPTPDELDDSNRALIDLQSYVVGHMKNFAHDIKDNSPEGYTPINSQALECYGKTFDNGEISFLPTALKKIIEIELGYQSMESLVAEWALKGKIRCSKGDGLRFSTRINGKKVKVYRFKAGVLLNADIDNSHESDEEFSAEI